MLQHAISEAAHLQFELFTRQSAQPKEITQFGIDCDRLRGNLNCFQTDGRRLPLACSLTSLARLPLSNRINTDPQRRIVYDWTKGSQDLLFAFSSVDDGVDA